MDTTIEDFLNSHKRWVAAFAVVCLVDMMNCVRLEHTDWWFPASLAIVAVVALKKEPDDETEF